MEKQSQQDGYMFIPGATTIGVTFKDGVILASEKRVSYGYLVVSKTGKKVFKITDLIGAACAGLVSDMQVLVREVEAYVNLFVLDAGRPISVRSTAKLMSNLLFNRRLGPLITQTIVGGIDDEGPSLYSLDPLGSVLPDKYTVVGSGTELAIGVDRRRIQGQHECSRSKRAGRQSYEIRHKQGHHERRRNGFSDNNQRRDTRRIDKVLDPIFKNA